MDWSVLRPVMLARAVWQPPVALGAHDELPALDVIGQVAEGEEDAWLWVDGLNIDDPVLLALPSDWRSLPGVVDAGSILREHATELAALLEQAASASVELSPTLMVRAVMAMRDEELEAGQALDLVLAWSGRILQLSGRQ